MELYTSNHMCRELAHFLFKKGRTIGVKRNSLPFQYALKSGLFELLTDTVAVAEYANSM